MKHQIFTMKLQLVCLLLTAMLLAGAASAATVTNGQIAVTSTTLDPEILMPGDTGILEVQVQNTGTTAITIDRADIMSSSIQVLNYQTYDKVGTLGAGDSLKFTFTLKAGGEEGVFFPEFYVNLGDAGSMRYPIPVRVDATGILVSVIDVPDSFVKGDVNLVTLTVSNPRKNTVTGVTVTPLGEGFRSTQTSIFVGSLEPDAMKNVTFKITPDRSTDLTFNVTYNNGMNRHTASVVLPVSIGERVTSANPVVNNIELSQSGGTWTLKGDVTNAGLDDAKSVVATMGDPATPADPNKIYVVGALEADDFSSFELEFTAPGVSSVPLIIQYKDNDGKSYESTVDISLTGSSSGTSGSAAGMGQASSQTGNRNGGPGMMGFGSGFQNIPLTEIIVAIAAAVGIFIAWRKIISPKLRARAREKAKK